MFLYKHKHIGRFLIFKSALLWCTFNLNRRLKWNTSSQMFKLHFIFYQSCIKGPFQIKSKKNEHGEGDNAHPNVGSKSNNNERKSLTHHEIHHYRRNCVCDQSSVQRNKSVDSSELTATNSSFNYPFKFTYFCIIDTRT